MRKILVLVTLLALPFCYAQEKIEYVDYDDVLLKVSQYVLKDEFSKIFNELDKIHPNDSLYETTVLLKSYYKLEQKKYDEALKYANQGISNNSFTSKYSFFVNKGVAYLRAKRYQDAVDVYTEVIKEFPKNHILYYNKAVAYEGVENFEKAIEYYAEGKVKKEMNYEDDELEGSYKVYYKNGMLKEEVNYKRGSYYYSEGKLIKKRAFYNGLVEKETEF